jgi:hypothetical protein
MMNKNTTALAYGVVLATIFAVLVTYVVYGAWPRLHIPLTLMMFIGLWVAFFITGLWIFNRGFPIGGAEHRRRRREFYEWLRRSQGRH